MALTNWSLLGTPAQEIRNHSVGRNADGRLEDFLIDVNNEIWHIWQTAPNGTWSSWTSLGKPSTSTEIYLDLDVIQNADGRLEVFSGGTDGELWHIWQNSPNGTWNTWTSFGPPPNVKFITFITGPTVAKNKDGRLEVLITGTDGALWHTWQVTPGKDWSNWDSLGALPNSTLFGPVVSENSDGRLEVFVASNDGLWHTWQVSPGSWG